MVNAGATIIDVGESTRPKRGRSERGRRADRVVPAIRKPIAQRFEVCGFLRDTSKPEVIREVRGAGGRAYYQ